MKKETVLCILAIFFAAASQALAENIREKKIEDRELPGYKLSPTNSILLEQSVRRAFKQVKSEEVENVEVHLKCEKKWKIRGRGNARSYQCDPIFLKVLKQ